MNPCELSASKAYYQCSLCSHSGIIVHILNEWNLLVQNTARWHALIPFTFYIAKESKLLHTAILYDHGAQLDLSWEKMNIRILHYKLQVWSAESCASVKHIFSGIKATK